MIKSGRHQKTRGKMKILLIHLDLGIGLSLSLLSSSLLLFSFFFLLLFLIGGAERLMVNLALAIQELGHTVKIFTSHHNQKRCFQETSKEG